MTDQEFFELVQQMRKAQRDFFATRRGRALDLSRQLEKQVDKEIERRTSTQMALFEDSDQ